MTIADALKALTSYPLPLRTIELIAEGRGLCATEFVNPADTAFALAKADVYMWLATAPDVSQGGQSYSFSDEQRKHFRAEAVALYGANDTVYKRASIYGYKGSKL